MNKTIVVRVALYGRELKDYGFDQDLVTIGRDPESDICLPNWGVSRIHVQLRRGRAGFFLTDPGSANGTLVNGERTTERDLATGDEISIQSFTLAVEILGRRNDPLLNRNFLPHDFDLPTVRSSP